MTNICTDTWNKKMTSFYANSAAKHCGRVMSTSKEFSFHDPDSDRKETGDVLRHGNKSSSGKVRRGGRKDSLDRDGGGNAALPQSRKRKQGTDLSALEGGVATGKFAASSRRKIHAER
jgi:hypothetical protein